MLSIESGKDGNSSDDQLISDDILLNYVNVPTIFQLKPVRMNINISY